jgi:hypothetical protein
MSDRIHNAVSGALRRFAATIAHGDAEHRQWLLDAADAFADDEPVPEMRGTSIGDTPVRIWSTEWQAYWRPKGQGYTARASDAWILSLREALRQTETCGSEKRICFEPVKDRPQLVEPKPMDIEDQYQVQEARKS